MTTLDTSNQTISTISLPHDRVIPTDRRFLNRECANFKQLNKLNVDPKYQEFVRVLDVQKEQDSEDTLYLLHYLTIVDENGNVDLSILNEIGHVRGIILDQNNNIICRSFGFTPELRFENFDQNLDNFRAFKAYEGTVIRLYHWCGRWNLSTHRKIDASNSYWLGPSFGDMFYEAFDLDSESLEKNKCYVFILQHPQNRAIFNVSKPFLPQVAVYDRETCVFNIVQSPEHTFTRESLQEFLDETARDKMAEKAGVILFPENNFAPVKVMSDFYLQLREVRGNEPSLRNRYIRNLNNPTALELLIDNYPEFNRELADRQLDLLCKKLHQEYIIRYVKKSRQQIPKEEHVVLMRCHTWHREDPANNIVRFEKVKETLKSTPAKFLIAMLNRL